MITEPTAPSKTKLAIVCTPIGNLGDLSPRAAAVLKDASLVLCEDTRHSRPLLERIGSHAKLVSCHAHNERDPAFHTRAAKGVEEVGRRGRGAER